MESGQRTGPKLEIRVVSNEQHILRKLLTSDSDNKLQATVSTALTIPWPGWVLGPAPWHGDGARNGAAACFNCRHQLADTGQQAGLLTSSHDSEREMPSKLWPHDSDNQHRRSSVRHLPSPGPEWVRSPAPRHGDGARNGAAACFNCSDPSHRSDRETPSKLWPRDSDTQHRRSSVRHLPSPGPEWVRSPAPRHGDGARNGAAACFNCSDPSHRSDRETPSKLWPRDSDTQHRRSSVRHLPSPGPEWVRGPAPRHGDGARNGAAACTTYCLDNARSRAAGATAFMQHPDPGPRTTCTPPVSSPARCRATGGKAKYGTESPWLRWWFAAHLAGGPTPAATKASAAKH